jgi:hypothetical protein
MVGEHRVRGDAAYRSNSKTVHMKKQCKRGVFSFAIAICVVVWSACAHAHEFKLDMVINAFVTVEPGEAHLVVRAPLYLFKSAKFPIRNAEIDIPQSNEAMRRALLGLQQDLVLFEDGRKLSASSAAGRVSLPSDRSFDTYDSALRHVAEPVASDTQIYVDQGYVDAHVVYPLQSSNGEISFRTTAAPELGDALKVTIRYQPMQGAARTLITNSTKGTVALNPTWWRAAGGFVGLGMEHILTGYDHLLFLLCLIIPVRGWRQIVTVVSTFTVAHSFTLIGSAFHLAPSGAWFPPFVEATIAASIVYMALENIMGVDFARRVLITGLFGLVHGFGFSYGLQENLQFAGTHLLVSLFAFNIGIEMGQMLVLAFMLPALMLILRYVLAGRVGMIILSALVAHTGWHWMLDRGEALLNAPWPRPTLIGTAVTLFWLAAILAAAAGIRMALKRLHAGTAPLLATSKKGAAD